MSNIEWTDRTWNPVTGCTKVSAGCANCYAETWAHRGMGEWKGRGFGEVKTHYDRLELPLHWKKPQRIFVNSMSDLFHEKVPMEFIECVFETMDRSPQHTFQILTKRPERMLRVLRDWTPRPNIWLGVSAESQRMADDRIPVLMKLPAAVRFLSVEPMLEGIDIKKFLPHWACQKCGKKLFNHELDLEKELCSPGCNPKWAVENGHQTTGKIDWVICGGESGHGARPFNVEWARSLRDQCKAVGTSFFMKQMGKNVFDRNDQGFDGEVAKNWPTGTMYREGKYSEPCQGALLEIKLKDRKGGDPEEWPTDLRIREFPGGAKA